MIRKLQSGKYRLYSRKRGPSTGRRHNLGTFGSRAAAERHERAVLYFKRQGYSTGTSAPSPHRSTRILGTRARFGIRRADDIR